MLWSVAALLLAAQAAEPRAAITPDWHGLFIGCTEYPQEKKRAPEAYGSVQLRGSTNDVELLSSRIAEYYAGEWSSLSVLSGWSNSDPARNPTLANIRSELLGLAQQELAGDRVVIYFAGHGCQQLDRGIKDEADGLDEVLLPANATRDGRGGWENALVDDELGRRVQRLTEAGATVWVILDCCYAATGIRDSGDVRNRGLPSGVVVPSRSAPSRDDLEVDRPAGPSKVIEFYASESDRRAPEAEFAVEPGQTRWHGVFSWYLAEAIEQSHPEETFEQLFDRASRMCLEHGGYASTTPSLSGDSTRRIGFDGKSATGDGWLQSAECRRTFGPLRIWLRSRDEAAQAVLGELAAESDGAFVLGSESEADLVIGRYEGLWVIDPAGEDRTASWTWDERELSKILGGLNLVRIAREAESQNEADFGLSAELEIRSGGETESIPAGEAWRVRVKWSDGPPVDLYAFLVDARGVRKVLHGVDGRLTRNEPGSIPIGRDERPFERRYVDVLADSTGVEHIVLFAFEAIRGEGQTRLGRIDPTEVSRSGLGAKHAPVKRIWARAIPFRTHWRSEDLDAPIDRHVDRHLSDGAITVDLGIQFHDDLQIADLGQGATELRIDLDRPVAPSALAAVGRPSTRRFDVILRRDGKGWVARYGASNDLRRSLSLYDADGNGVSESLRVGGVEGRVPGRLPLLDASHLEGAVRHRQSLEAFMRKLLR